MIFIDSAAFVARFIERDQFHAEAVAAWKRLPDEGARHFTSNFVLDETITLLGRWGGYSFAAERARNLYASRALEILRPTTNDESTALTLFEKYADQRVSFTDCVSFALMQRLRLSKVFTFDRHFELAGFQLWP